MSVLCVFLIILFLYILYWLKTLLKFRSIVNEFPGRACNFLFGNIIDMPLQPDKVYDHFKDLHKEFPDGYRLWAGQYGIINLVKADDVKVVLSNPELVEKNFVYEFLQLWMGTGLVTSSGSKWRQRRKLLTPAFHLNILKRFVHIFYEHGMQLTKELADECNKSKTDIIPLMTKCTLNIISDTSMGITLDLDDKNQRKYFETIDSFASMVMQRFLQPLYYLDFLFNLSPLGRQCNKDINILQEFTTNIIKERERMFNDNILEIIEDDQEMASSKKHFAMLDLLISAKKYNAEIDDDGIREEVNTFLAAGHETCTKAISFVLLMLANHQNIQERVRAEIDDIFGNSDRHATYNDLQKLLYLDMCIKETLRICPVVPIISRKITKETKLRGSKYTMPVGLIVFIHIYALHRDPKVFPDPEKFNPDRFLPENVKSRHPYAYIPFSAGPRICIGQKFAMLEMKSIISSILRYYDLEAVESISNKKLQVNIVVRVIDGINIKFKARRQ